MCTELRIGYNSLNICKPFCELFLLNNGTYIFSIIIIFMIWVNGSATDIDIHLITYLTIFSRALRFLGAHPKGVVIKLMRHANRST